MEGWISLHRKFLGWEWFDKPEMVQLFIWMLLNANYTDKKWRGIEVKRGQLIVTSPMIQEALNLSEQRTKTCIQRLKSTGEITTKSTNKYTIVTICNYDRYQTEEFSSNGQNNKQSNGQTTDKQRTKQRTSNGRLYDTLNVSKQINNNNNNNNNISVCDNNALTREDKERDIIFSIFFLKNFINPAAEVDRFYDNYESQGWVRGNGQKITNKVAVAKSWEQVEKGQKRFPEPFIEAMREIADTPFFEPVILRGIDRVDYDDARVNIYCTQQVYEAIEKSEARNILAEKVRRPIRYRVKRAN